MGWTDGFRIAGLVSVVLIAGVLSGCGSDGASQEDLDRARAEGAKEARQQAKVQQLQRQMNQLRRRQRQSGRRNSGGSVSGSSAPSMVPAKTCGGGIGASSATSCEFALNVAGEYGSNPGAATIQAYSPVTGRYYTMSCAPMGGWSAVCAGGSNAVVFIP